jgi:hypothetical protein
MSKIDELLILASKFEDKASESLVKVAKKKEKLDPKADIRNRGKVVFPAESPKVKDHKDHFELNTANQARNALARCKQYSKAPPWYKGTLKELQDTVARKVRQHYKSIDVGGKEKKSEELFNTILKNAEEKYN